jgi:cystathionine gamma-lyase
VTSLEPTHFATRAVHAGQDPDPATGATVPPIHVSSTYTQRAPGDHLGFEYSRTDNPTRRGYEACLAALEEGCGAAAFASGLAAETAVLMSLLRPGDSVVAFADLYGGTYRLLEQVLRPWGLEIRYALGRDPEAFSRLMDETTRMVWLETPTNPMLHLLPIGAIARAVRRRRRQLKLQGQRPEPGRPRTTTRSPDQEDLVVLVDNTFASPALQLPLRLGADVVVHSTTKYIGGHSDLIGGAVICKHPRHLEAVRFQQNAAGAVPGAFSCYLAQRGVKTLELRMRRHCENALAIADWASRQPQFERVIYPGLPDHPDHALAREQMDGFGGMVSGVLRGGLEAARAFLSAIRLFACAESLGGVESLINHPASMTHASVPAEIRDRLGIAPGLVRLSAGIEHADDLIADLSQALAVVGARR